MQCGACGQALADGSSVCTHCGATLPAAGQAPVNRLIDRVKAILLTPKTEWPVIAAESAAAQDIYLRYVAPLAAIGVIATFIGSVLIGFPVPLLGTVRVGVGSGLAAAILHFLLTFASVFIVAQIVDALAPTFGGQKDPLAALKVTAYSFTPAWVAAILTILPALGFIAALIGLYGLYLLYLGLPVLMRAAPDRALGYTVIVVLCAIVVSIVIAALTGLLTGGVGTPPL
jgi:Yip1-like protein